MATTKFTIVLILIIMEDTHGAEKAVLESKELNAKS